MGTFYRLYLKGICVFQEKDLVNGEKMINYCKHFSKAYDVQGAERRKLVPARSLPWRPGQPRQDWPFIFLTSSKLIFVLSR
jgi:hypothetical protein